MNLERIEASVPCCDTTYRRLADSFNLLFWRKRAVSDTDTLAVQVLKECLHYGRMPARLIVAGPPIENSAMERALQLGIAGAIEHCTMADEAVRNAVLRAADVLLNLGGGAPPDTASAWRLPVVAPDGAEAGDGALVFDAADARELGAACAWIATEPALRRAFLEVDLEGLWLVDGPFDSSYSLAIVNRELALALARRGKAAALANHEWEAGREPDWAFLAGRPETQTLFARGRSNARPMLHLRNNYPPKVSDMRGGINLLANYAWEESGFPAEDVQAFNERLDLITVSSPLVKQILRNNGVRTPIAAVGNGVDHLAALSSEPPPQPLGKGFRFLHVSSCFPRKGVDVLLEAFGRAFDCNDDVSLVIKTFPNPHNDVAERLKRHRLDNPAFPDVVLIEEDWPETQVAGLYTACHALVMPSRAEGFGLPAAEALLAGLPVIATGFGGHRCFCNSDNAWLIDYRFARSKSHLGLPDSAWVEPDADDLAKRLREVYSAPVEERRRRADQGRELLLARFAWDRVAARTIAAVEAVAGQPALRPEPLIGWVSTWNSRCGIATYSAHLVCRIPRRRLRVFANTDAVPLGEDEDFVSRTWSRGEPAGRALAEAILAQGIEAAVIQYHYAFMPLSELAKLIGHLARHGVPVYLTLHNTSPPGPEVSLADIRPILKKARRILVHSIEDLNRMKGYGLVDNVCLFPHGVYPSPPPPGDALRARLKLEGRRVIATAGFMLPHKGYQALLHAFAQLAGQRPNLHLLMLNALYPDQRSLDERDACLALARELGIDRKITMVNDFLPDAECIATLSLADLVVFPYQDTNESASGAVRMGLAARRPVAVTPLPIFDDVEEAVRRLPGITPEAMAEGLDRLLEELAEPERRDAVIAGITRWCAARQWDDLSERLLNLIDGEAGNLPEEGFL